MNKRQRKKKFFKVMDPLLEEQARKQGLKPRELYHRIRIKTMNEIIYSSFVRMPGSGRPLGIMKEGEK